MILSLCNSTKRVQKRTAKKKDGNGKDIFIVPNKYRTLHWKDAFIRKKRESEQ